MHTIKLKISDTVYERFLWLLSKFNKEEVEILSEENDFTTTKSYLENELEEIVSENASFYSQEELENRLDAVIQKHEDNL